MPRRSRGISFSGITIQQLSMTASAHTGQHSSPLRGTHSFSVGATTSTEVLSLVQVQEEKELNKSNLYLSSTYSPNRHGLRVPPSLMQGYDPKAKTTCMYEGRILTNPRTIHSQSQIQWHSMEQMSLVLHFPILKIYRLHLHLYTSILDRSWEFIFFFCPINRYSSIHHRIVKYPKLEENHKGDLPS